MLFDNLLKGNRNGIDKNPACVLFWGCGKQWIQKPPILVQKAD
jgi:hypothetical protein